VPLKPFPSPINIGDVVTKLNNIQNIKTIDDFKVQQESLVQAVENLKVHLTDQDTQINGLNQQIASGQLQITSIISQNELLKQQVSTQQTTIDQLKARLNAISAAPPPATPIALADSFRKVVDQIQTQARLQSASGPATTIRSMDIEVKGLVNVQDGNTVLVLPTPGSQLDPNQLSTLRVSFAAIPATGRAAPPTVTGVSPGSGPSAGGTSVTVSGSGLTAAGGVRFGGTPAATFSVVSDTQILAVSPPGTGTVDVMVLSASGGASSTSQADQFAYIPAPAVTAITPNTGPPAGGTTVTMTGARFSGASAVTFGTAAAGSFSVVSDSQMTAVSPPGTAGATVDILVTTASGASAPGQASRFTYAGSPTPGTPGTAGGGTATPTATTARPRG